VFLALGRAHGAADASTLADIAYTLAWAVQRGHSAWPLQRLAPAEQALLSRGHPLVGQGMPSPGVLLQVAFGCVAFARQHDSEQRIAQRLAARVRWPALPAAALPGIGRALNDEQSQAVWVAVTRGLAVVSGGPGTGKTTCLSALLAHVLRGEPAPRVALAAPTGKAATRMREAIEQGTAQWPDRELAQRALALQPTTLHRLLQPLPGGRGMRRNAGNPLACDLLVIDECSMLDLDLADQVLDALAPQARLVLLGDRDQLAAVENGAVFHALAGSVTDASPVAEVAVQLVRSWRFDTAGALGRTADAVRRGDVAALDQALAAAADHEDASIAWLPTDEGAATGAVLDTLVAPWADYARAVASGQGAAQIGAVARRYQVLCAVNEGPWGTAALNARIGRAVRQQVGAALQADGNFHGRWVMATRNDAGLGIANGEVGVVLRGADGGLQVHFAQPAGEMCAPAAAVESLVDAFAVTVHKAQGSEYDAVALVLPRADSPVLGRELLYTGLTRARQRVVMVGTREALHAAVRRSTQRVSTLAARLQALLAADTSRGEAPSEASSAQ
ncbi:MAG: exodeoxyribonuclease V subunit alpha, partial [Betaproteobacteria bacterium]|nr:exodeoxyribonuclease V subunit alpha [Betaproteobacteria bacterium]